MIRLHSDCWKSISYQDSPGLPLYSDWLSEYDVWQTPTLVGTKEWVSVVPGVSEAVSNYVLPGD